MVPAAIGTDTGGSVRLPASYCGLAGLKTTVGRVSLHGILLLSGTLDTPGPMTRSVEAGSPQTLDSVQTVAVSLAASRAEPLTFSAVQAHVDRMLTLPDSALIAAMRRFNTDLSLMVEPACAASFAALTGPLRAELAGKRVAVIACGSNIGRAGHARILDAS
jgi:threonine dehydratase